MTIRVVLACNGMEGILPCRQATPVGEVQTAVEARRIAAKLHGWSARAVGAVVLDLCSACTRRAAA